MRNTAGAAGVGFYNNDMKNNTSKKQSAIKNYGDIAYQLLGNNGAPTS